MTRVEEGAVLKLSYSVSCSVKSTREGLAVLVGMRGRDDAEEGTSECSVGRGSKVFGEDVASTAMDDQARGYGVWPGGRGSVFHFLHCASCGCQIEEGFL